MTKVSQTRKHPLAKCEECPLMDSPCAPTIGPANAKLAVVSRSPGKYEAKKGVPFSGPSGKVLDYLLNQNGVKREDTLLTNVVLCYTDSPTTKAIEACSDRLHSELRSADTIIAAGSEATTELTGSRSIGGSRGYAHKRILGASVGHEQRVIVTNNPAVVLKDDKTFPDIVKDFRLAINPRPQATLPTIKWTNDPRQGRDWLRRISKETPTRLSCDIESFGLRPQAKLASIAFSATGDKAVSFGVNVVNGDNECKELLRTILEKTSIRFVWHNGKFDVRNLRQKGINARVDGDTLLLSYILDERSDEPVHSLDYLLMDELAWPYYEPYVVQQWKSKVKNLEKAGKYEELDNLEVPDELYEYNGLDAAGSMQLYPILYDKAVKDNVISPYEKLLIPGSEALVYLELAGMHYNVTKAADLWEEEVRPKLNEWKAQLQTKVGNGSYNPNSAKQNSDLVYDEWMLLPKVAERKGKERSVDKPIYTAIKEGDFNIGAPITSTIGSAATTRLRSTIIEWAELLAFFKELDKQRGTYIEGLIKRALRNHGIINTSLKLHGTSSGRLSSSDPNLQNITRPKAGLPNIRQLFHAPEGHVILNADFSQAEMRVIAYLSNNPKLVKIYRDGISLHKVVAERFYGKDYNYEQYTYAKNMDFGVAYGQTGRTFKEKHDIPVEQGERFVKWWYEEFDTVKDLQKEIHEQAFKQGFVQTETGRKRRFHLITDQNKNEVRREAFNFVPQSTASDFTLHSVIQLVNEFNPKWGNIVLSVHDSIVADICDNYVDECATIFKQVMEASPKDLLGWDFPFEVDIGIGPNWGELEEISV